MIDNKAVKFNQNFAGRQALSTTMRAPLGTWSNTVGSPSTRPKTFTGLAGRISEPRLARSEERRVGKESRSQGEDSNFQHRPYPPPPASHHYYSYMEPDHHRKPRREGPSYPHRSFFFSSRRRHTRFSRDWSSDVCSSDLKHRGVAVHPAEDVHGARRADLRTPAG